MTFEATGAKARKLYIKYFRVHGQTISGSLVFAGLRPDNVRDGWAITLTKWRLLIKQGYPTIENGVATCGLCSLFWNPIKNECVDGNGDQCPIASAVEDGDFCQNTPYRDYKDALRTGCDIHILRFLAEQELKFLLSVFSEWKAREKMLREAQNT